MKKTHKTKSITCRIVSTGIMMQVNTIDEILSPGHYKIDACRVTASDGFPDGVDGECLSAYLEVSDTNHSADNLKSAAVGQTLTYTDADGSTAVYHRSGTSKQGKVEWSAWSDTAALGLQNGSITADKLSKDVRIKIESPLRPLFIAAGAEYNDSGADKSKTAPWGETVTHKAGHYYLNGLGDITEEQMMEIYNEKDTIFKLWQNSFANKNDSVRTFIPITKARLYDYKAAVNLDFGVGLSNLETVVFNVKSVSSTDLASMLRIDKAIRFFADCPKLRFLGFINVSDMLAGGIIGFQNCTALEYVNIINLKLSLSLEHSPLISKHSIQQMIDKATPTTAITIKLHPEAYARLADDADIVAALEEQPLISLVSA